MKIVILDSWFHWPPRGGGIRSIKELANGLSKKGHDVTLIAPNYGGRGKVRNESELEFDIQKINFNKVTFNGINLFKRMKKKVEESKPDLTFIGNGNLLKPYMMLACKNFPSIVRLYAYELLCPISFGILFKNNVCRTNFLSSPSHCVPCLFNRKFIPRLNYELLRSFAIFYPLYLRLVKKSLLHPKKYIVTSNYMKKRFSEIIPAEKLEIIQEGVNTNEFIPAKKASSEVKLIFAPGRMPDPLKGIGVLLKAGKLLWNQRHDFRILVTGIKSSFSEDYPFITSIGWKSGSELSETYANSDIVAVPSIWAEPFGLTGLEALSCGTPVVASKIGGLQDFIIDNETGITVPPGNPEALAGAINRLLDDADLRHRLGNNGRKLVLEKYTWPVAIQKHLSLIEETVQ